MGHEYQDRVSLEIASRIAAGLPEHPEWVALARDNLSRWSRRNEDSPSLVRCYDEWRALLNLPVAEICTILTGDTDESRRLRQNSPFVGVLAPQQVWDVKREIRAEMEAGPSVSSRDAEQRSPNELEGDELLPDQPFHPEARAFVARWFDEAWGEGVWAASWSKSLEGLTAEQAASVPGGARHSIWQQVLHMCYWRERHLRRIETGQAPGDGDMAALNWPRITDVSEGAWAAARARFAGTQRRIGELLRDLDPRHDVLVHFFAHDCYHFGQINSLRAMLGLKAIE